jgi:hypothetical protein
MALDVQKIIGRVAEQHGVLLGPDDPAFYSLYLYEAVLEETITRMEEERDAWAHELLTEVRGQVAGTRNAGPSAFSAAAASLIQDVRREVAVVRAAGRQVMLAALACLGVAVLTLAGTAAFWLSR